MADTTALDNSIQLLTTFTVNAATEADLLTITKRARTAQHAIQRILLDITNQATRLHNQGLSGTPTEILSKAGNVAKETARKEAARSQATQTVPGLQEAFTNGEVTAGHLDIVARKTRTLKPEQQPFLNTERLLQQAKICSPDQFERAVKHEIDKARNDWGLGQAIADREKSHVKMWRDRNTGMGHIHAVLDPERFDAVRGIIGREVSSLAAASKASGGTVTKDEFLAADALVGLLDRGNAASGGVSRPLITLVVDSDTAIAGPHERSVRETSYGTELPPESIQRYLCDAVVETLLLADGEQPRTGRKARTATNAQWTALRALYRSCGWEGCDAPIDHCQAHHVKFWENGGDTNLDNLVPLCSAHHHRVHEGKWGLRLKPNRGLEIRRPDGHLWATAKPDRLEPLLSRSPDGSEPMELADLTKLAVAKC